NAIATDKVAYLPGAGAATFASVSSYDRGINGIMVDISGPHGTITANDFAFKVGGANASANNLATWTAGPAVAPVSVRAGAGTGGSDRVELIWADGSIKQKWLEVQVLANTDTGLAANDVFFFDSSVGDDGTLPDDASAFRTTATDELDARSNPRT